MNAPRLTIAATHSGTGKTTITAGLILALRNRGLTIQPFKVGPDYIDPGFHTLAAGRPGRNLDTVMISEEAVAELFLHAAGGGGTAGGAAGKHGSFFPPADLSVIEGVMGLYDGFSGEVETGSTAHLAKVLHSPVVLCIDARAMARSAAAVALGFVRFDPAARICGFILNNIGSPHHFELVKGIIEETTKLPVFGYLPKQGEIALPERHLGLVPAWERDELPEAERLAGLVEEYIDVDRTIEAARSAPELEVRQLDASETPGPHGGSKIFPQTQISSNTGRVKIGYALDDAFHFYYQDNLDILEWYGAELVPFSPLRDDRLPEGIAGIYIGGGYPELRAEALAGNTGMTESLRKAARSGMPIYAECGGLMYLVEELVTFEGVTFPMAGLFPGKVIMEKKLAALGYYRGTALEDTPIAKKGWSVWGHVFHWSRLEGVAQNQRFGFTLEKPGKDPVTDGLLEGNVLAGYFHIHFAGNVAWPKRFIQLCERHGLEN
jgi:cobyrinic acid a,c-diamide synthase